MFKPQFPWIRLFENQLGSQNLNNLIKTSVLTASIKNYPQDTAALYALHVYRIGCQKSNILSLNQIMSFDFYKKYNIPQKYNFSKDLNLTEREITVINNNRPQFFTVIDELLGISRINAALKNPLTLIYPELLNNLKYSPYLQNITKNTNFDAVYTYNQDFLKFIAFDQKRQPAGLNFQNHIRMFSEEECAKKLVSFHKSMLLYMLNLKRTNKITAAEVDPFIAALTDNLNFYNRTNDLENAVFNWNSFFEFHKNIFINRGHGFNFITYISKDTFFINPVLRTHYDETYKYFISNDSPLYEILQQKINNNNSLLINSSREIRDILYDIYTNVSCF